MENKSPLPEAKTPKRGTETKVVVAVALLMGVYTIGYDNMLAIAPWTASRAAENNYNNNFNDCLLGVKGVRGIKLYSQNDEDGALLQTLRCMGGHGTKEYFEFGSESGVQVNTRVLRDLYGWHGHLLDGGYENKTINLHQAFFTPTNIVSLLEKYGASKHLDVLSVDCDYDDFYVIREILVAGYRPRVLITEYNSNFGTEWSVSVLPKPVGMEHQVGWQKDCYFGASATALIRLADAFGYAPVFSNGVNLIFVRAEAARALGLVLPSATNFPGPQPIAIHEDCQGRAWKLIDADDEGDAGNSGSGSGNRLRDVLREMATDPTVSHTEFTDSIEEARLVHENYGFPWVPLGRAWRVFRKEENKQG